MLGYADGASYSVSHNFNTYIFKVKVRKKRIVWKEREKQTRKRVMNVTPPRMESRAS